MHAGRFLSLVKNVTDLRPEEVGTAQDLAGRYPYSQLLHLLVARGIRDQKGAGEQAALHRAAVYATDRGVLKEVMTRARQPRVEIYEADEPEMPVPPAAVPKTTEPAIAPSEVIEVSGPSPAKTKVASAEVELEGDALRDDLKMELNRLHHLMSAFDATYEQLKKGVVQPADDTKAEPQPQKIARKSAPKDPAAPDTGDAPLIDEIRSSKRKPKLVTPKVAEQGEIIDQFIKVAPTLPRTKPKEPTTDLSEESVNYGDNIVSETLVEILLKQGKKAKAIEMLKKLIWKFPQKKAYFAAQIEALKS